MDEASGLGQKIRAIQAVFGPVVGAKLAGFETAELLQEGDWSPWPDLPIRLRADSGKIVAVAWSKFDELWLATDHSLPFPIDESEVRWVPNAIEEFRSAVGGRIGEVLIGPEKMSFGGPDIEIWTRLAIEVGSGWFEVFNALDENGYRFHCRRPAGDFRKCV